MRAAEGAFCSSLDADSEHEEGKFYVWTAAEAEALLSADEWAVVRPHWGFDLPPNFEHREWHLRVAVPLADVAGSLGTTLADAEARLERARAKLFAARERRVHPGRDDKALTSWNALLIGALARAARACDEATWLTAAQNAADFIRAALWREGRLLATYKDGRAHLNAYLDDHAYLLAALLELLQTSFRAADLSWAIELADTLLLRFEDRAGGGFFFTSHDHEALLHRPKPAHDNATPAGNGIAAQALLTLGHWLGETRYLEAAERTMGAFARELDRPSGVSSLLIALDELVRPPVTVLLRGDAATCASWQRALERGYRPGVKVLDLSREGDLPGALSRPHQGDDAATAWVCTGNSCLPPLHSQEALEATLAAPG